MMSGSSRVTARRPSFGSGENGWKGYASMEKGKGSGRGREEWEVLRRLQEEISLSGEGDLVHGYKHDTSRVQIELGPRLIRVKTMCRSLAFSSQSLQCRRVKTSERCQWLPPYVLGQQHQTKGNSPSDFEYMIIWRRLCSFPPDLEAIQWWLNVSDAPPEQKCNET